MADDFTFGQMLFNDALPDDMKMTGPVTKKELKSAMSAYAKKNPEGYVKAIQNVKRVGDEVATWGGLSVGLDDIQPDYNRRDPIIKNALRDMKSAKTDKQKRDILLRTQDSILEATQQHPSDMTLMARSGGRGSIAQLMKTVSSPVVATTSSGEVTPWLVTKSYAQGLNPADAWVTGVESRRNAIASTGSVVEPGAVAKVVVTNMDNLVITKEDCGTMNGIILSIDDQAVDRYLARGEGSHSRNTLVTPAVLNSLKKDNVKKVLVRSPSTCAARDGICQKCMGLDEWGNDHRVGTNVGVRGAQALTEPLTQFALNAKHGVRLAGQNKELRGLKGFRILTEVPKSFTEKAAIAKKDGKVDTVTKAPQGGWYITVSGKRYYSPPGLKPIVKEGTRVEAGDALTEGTPMPDEVVKYKGIGEGRRYLSNSITELYRRQGVDIDRRHPELLARKAMNHVRVREDASGEFIPGDIVEYDALARAVTKNTTRVPLEKAKNKTLAAPILHYSVGTRLTPSVLDQLKAEGISEVEISENGPTFDPVMKSLIQTPLLNDDWMSRLSHRYLRRTLMDGAGFGYSSDIASTSPVPAYVLGAPFGTGSEGKYASELKQFLVDTLSAPINRPSLMVGRKSEETAELAPPEPDVESIEDQVMAALESMSAQPPEEPTSVEPPEEIPPPEVHLEDNDKTAGIKDRLAGGAKRVLFGAPGKGTSKLHNALGDDSLKLINASGGVESRATDLRHMMNDMPDFNPEAAGITRGGIITDEGVQFVDSLREMRGGVFDGVHKANPAAAQRWGKRWFTPGISATGPQYRPEQLEKIQEGLSQHVTPEMFAQYMDKQTGGRRMLRGLRGAALGEAPMEVTRQRFRTGGILGKGGLIRSDFAIDPDTIRAWKDYKQGGPLRPLLGSAGMEALNKYMSMYLPGRAVYEAVQGPSGEGESRYENVGGALGEVAGWSVGAPFGMVGGLALASPTIAAGKALGRKLDPNYTPPSQDQQAPVLQRVRNTYTEGIQHHPYADYYREVNRARNAAQQRWFSDQQQQQQSPYQ